MLLEKIFIINYFFSSVQFSSTKLGVAIGQFKRVQQICNNTKTLVEGEEIVRKTLKNCNYPVSVIEKACSISIAKKKEENKI